MERKNVSQEKEKAGQVDGQNSKVKWDKKKTDEVDLGSPIDIPKLKLVYSYTKDKELLEQIGFTAIALTLILSLFRVGYTTLGTATMTQLLIVDLIILITFLIFLMVLFQIFIKMFELHLNLVRFEAVPDSRDTILQPRLDPRKRITKGANDYLEIDPVRYERTQGL